MDHWEHWTDVVANVTVAYWPVAVVVLGIGVAALVARRALRNRPRTRTSAMDRLIERNPAIMFDGARWTVTAQRVRIGWITSFAVATALLIVADRPARPSAN